MAEPLLQVQDLRVEFPARRGPRRPSHDAGNA